MQRHTKIKLLGKIQQVPYPNYGQEIEIESLKQLLSGGTYGQLSRSGHTTADRLLDLIDAIATFSVLCPELKEKGVSPEKFETLDPVLAARLRKAYREYHKFLEKVQKEIEALVEQANSENESDDEEED